MNTAEATPARRDALIVATDLYEDPKLRALRAPARDAEELARVLGDPEIGDFRVDVSRNEPDHVVRRKLSEFFRDRNRDDLLVLHLSCHGLKDEDGTLYFASANTALEHLEATAVPSEFVNRQMTRSRSRRIVLLLDCCFGGAFARGMVHRADSNVAIKEELGGQGRVVLTASRAMEYAFEGDDREGDAQPSIFTAAIVQGLESGDADRDYDSRVSVDELYEYVYERVRETTPNQTPSKWTFDVHGDLYVARSPYREPEPVELPAELRAAAESPFANVRAGAVEELARLSAGADARLAAAARVVLAELSNDDSKRVSEAAADAVERAAPARPRPAVPVKVLPEPSPSALSVAVAPLARVARWQDAIALAGAALLFFAYFRSASTDAPSTATPWFWAKETKEAIWAFWSPLEAFGAALLVAAAVWAARTHRFRRESVDGLLLAVGLVAFAAMLGLIGAYFELDWAPALTGLGALAIAGAGVLGLLTRRAPDAGLPRGALALAVAGSVLGLAPLFVGVAKWEGSELLGKAWGGPAYLAPLVAVVAAASALLLLVRVRRGRVPAAGVLVGVGLMLALHCAGIVVQIARDDELGWVRLGGPLGLAGGVLLVAAGASVLRRQGAEGLRA